MRGTERAIYAAPRRADVTTALALRRFGISSQG